MCKFTPQEPYFYQQCFSNFKYEEEDDGDVRAWGNKKKHFYGGNPNDPKNQNASPKQANLHIESTKGVFSQSTERMINKIGDENLNILHFVNFVTLL